MPKDNIDEKLKSCLIRRGLMCDSKSYNQRVRHAKMTKAVRIAVMAKREEVDDARDSGGQPQY